MDEGGVRAVLFDLHDTLVPSGHPAEHDAVARAMGADLGVDPDAFATVVSETFDERVRGLMAEMHHTVRYLARQVGGSPTESQVESAIRRRLDYSLSLHGATWALPALKALRKRGFRLGVVADCSAETIAIWPQSPLAEHLDGVSFSCQTGVRKPDSGAYLVAAAALEVSTNDCVYVGDGMDHELSGAEAVGMRAVRFQAPAAGRDPDWSGPTIDDLGELVGMIGVPMQRDQSASRTFVSGNVVPWGSKRSPR
ncbi:putative hydrolase of the HAD superfamily [Nocardioides albertanoniae]|uniref:Putative hydrolase of the HAD superfamily n=1 Tax=Nocardioides albertanoniae TaxID=1175486 RepID=A0A543A1H2_9ACTN|nr:HAD family hydrolase [Nocardioides albertanoniae]TQL66435.1 putative hydrolase of the HAD superfamily [Nocardioides albertanoniae]